MLASELKRLTESGTIILIDVRTEPEYKAGHIPGAISIPLDQLERNIKEYPKDQALVVYCLSGARAQSATWLLENLKYKNVTNFGGIINWPYRLKNDIINKRSEENGIKRN